MESPGHQWSRRVALMADGRQTGRRLATEATVDANINAGGGVVVNPAGLVVEGEGGTRGLADIGGLVHKSSQVGTSAASTPASPIRDVQFSNIMRLLSSQ